MSELTPFPSSFPLETEENIIDHLSDSVPALRCCALTCRAWLPRSRFYLLGSVRIKSGRQLEEFEDMLNTYPARRSWINSATMAPIAQESNPCRLIEAFPVALLANTPNLRRWEITQADIKTVKKRAVLFFHKTTLTRLRFSSIQELHLSSVQFGSYAELIRLLMALRQLDCLRCTNLGFSQDSTAGMGFLKAKACRQLEKLSTLVVREMKSTAISTLLEFVQDTLANLHFDHIKGMKWDALPLPNTNTMPALSIASLISLHWRIKPKNTESALDDFLTRVWTNAAGLTVNHLHWASNLQTISLHLHFDDFDSSWGPVLAIRRVLESMKQKYPHPDTTLSKMRLKQYLVSIHLPFRWVHTDAILKTCLEENLSRLYRAGLLTVEINAGASSCDMGPGYKPHGLIRAIVASPDAKWIATGSSDHSVLLWDIQHHAKGWIADHFRASVYSSSSLSFSPDSRRLVFHARVDSDFHIRQLGANGETTFLAALSLRKSNVNTELSNSHYHCAWSHDGSKVSAVRFSPSPRVSVDARVWDTTTYTLLYILGDDSILERALGSAAVEGNLPVIGCTLDGHHLAMTRLDYITPPSEHHDGAVTPSPSSQRDASFSYHIWDISTGDRITTVDEFLREHPQNVGWIEPNAPELYQVTTRCGNDVRKWEFHSLSHDRPGYWISKSLERTPLSPSGLRRLSWSASWFKIWSTHPHQCISTFRCANVAGGCFSPDGQYVAICIEDYCTGDGLVQIGTVSGGVLVGSFKYECIFDRKMGDRAIIFSRDGKTVYLAPPFNALIHFPLPSPLPDDADHEVHAERWERCDDED